MTKKKFIDIVAENFGEIQNNFKVAAKNKGYPYNEDIMNDAFISCLQSLKNKVLTKSEALKYYWTSYVNKIKSNYRYSNYIEYINVDDIDSIDDEVYDDAIDQIYDIVLNEIRDKFGIKDAYIWELYNCKGKSAKEIRAMGFNSIDNFVYFNRKIKRYILNHVIPNNTKLRELINNKRGT